MKKFISLLLTAIMLLSVFSTVVSADEIDTGLPFTDVKEDAWYYEGIAFCYEYGVVSGMTETTFEPNGTLTRAQFVQILAMVDGVELEEYKNSESGFDDVKPNHWFNAPVCWAVEQGFVAGLSETRFGPNEKITREQLARLLYLYAEYCGCDVSRLADLSGYTDKPSDWAYTQVQWAVAAGIISGMDETTLAPRSSATRAQACRMIMSFYDFITYGYRDTSGAFAVIAEYIKINGTTDGEYPLYTVVEEYDEFHFIMEYDEKQNLIYISALREPYEYEEDGSTWVGYREGAGIYAYTLASEYQFHYYYENANGTDTMNSYGFLAAEEYYEEHADLNGYTPEVLAENVSRMTDSIIISITRILSDAGMTLDDFFLPEENRDLLSDLANYIITNGEGIDGWYVYGCASYDENTGTFCFMYDETVIEYPGMATKQEYASVFVNGLAHKYLYEYHINDITGETALSATFNGLLGNGFYNELTSEVSKGDLQTVLARKNMMLTELFGRIAVMLGNCGYDISELFLPENATQPIYDAMVSYVREKGIEDTENGIVDLIREVEDKVYVAEYDLNSDALYFVYASEPLPGGTDVFDTEYCEHAILSPEVPLDEVRFNYTYENEDGSVKITAEGSTAFGLLSVESLVYEGCTPEQARARVEAAMAEVLDYYNELIETVK